MEKGQILELTIDDMSLEGKGIGKADGFAVFVADAVVGDKVKVELTKVKKRYGFGRIVEMIEESEDRIEAFCEQQGECGGCPYGKLGYDAQLKLKGKQVKDKLQRLGGIADPIVYPVVAMDGEPFGYRNKASMPVSTGGLITRKGGIAEPVHEPRIGFFRAHSHEVADCRACALQSEPAMAAADALRRFMEEDHITSYDPRWEKGLMRHIVVRTAAGTGEVMVILVINGKAIPNASKLIEMLDDAIYNIPVYEEGPLANVEFNLESVVLNINKKNTSEIFGEECITIAGKPTITEEVAGMKFEISPLSFYQVNREQMVKMYDKVIEYADLTGKETVLDLYCGVGTIGLFCAREMKQRAEENNVAPEKSGRVIGIESIKAAVLNANRNAVLNGIVNARYICGKAEEVLPEIMGMCKTDKKSADDENVIRINNADIAVLDPPRAGCEERLLEAVIKAAPDRLVYVSCDPGTLARDVKWLEEHNYKFCEATPFDFYPWTGHVETVVLLSREKVDGYVSIDLDVEKLVGKSGIATYKEIMAYVKEKHGMSVSSSYIAQIKDKMGLEKRDNYNIGSGKSRKPVCPADKEEAIMDAFKHFNLI